MNDGGKLPDLQLIDRYLKTNPESAAKVIEDYLLIESPWGDDTITIRVGKDDKSLHEALNNVRLPRRFTAVKHLDTSDVEFIFGPVAVDSRLRERKFNFTLSGRSYLCEYANASDRLRAIAVAARPSGPPSDSDHRHLLLLRSFIKRYEEAKDRPKDKEFSLTSFWVRNSDLDDENLVTFASHLNFYMNYFDRNSPRVLIHPDLPADAAIGKLAPPDGKDFPKEISGQSLDPFLLGLWESGIGARDSVRLLLHSYQVLEYASFYYIRDEMQVALRRMLKAPDVSQRLDQVCRDVLDLVTEDRTADEQKIAAIISRAVTVDRLWKYLEQRKSYFSEAHQFDGGFSTAPLIKAEWGIDDFRAAWLPKLPDALRKIRNALVHAREQRIALSISATPRNLRLLIPWAELAQEVANEVILFGA